MKTYAGQPVGHVGKGYLAKLDDYETKGLLNKSVKGGLTLYNYTKTCQYSRAWDQITLNARGTVYDAEGNVVALAFPKFFNHFEPQAQNIDWGQPIDSVSEKVDGSLGLVFWHGDEWHVSTRGSFYSEQAAKGRELLGKIDGFEFLPKGLTYLVEIVYPDNKILLDYGDQEFLALLAVRDPETGEYKNVKHFAHWFKVAEQNWPETPTMETFEHLSQSWTSKEEGLVVRFADGTHVKVKSRRYLEVAKMKERVTARGIWDLVIKEGGIRKAEEILTEELPDELLPEAMQILGQLSGLVDNLKDLVFNMCSSMGIYSYDRSSKEERKRLAIQINTEVPEKLRPFLFVVLNSPDFYGKLDVLTIRHFEPRNGAFGD